MAKESPLGIFLFVSEWVVVVVVVIIIIIIIPCYRPDSASQYFLGKLCRQTCGNRVTVSTSRPR